MLMRMVMELLMRRDNEKDSYVEEECFVGTTRLSNQSRAFCGYTPSLQIYHNLFLMPNLSNLLFTTCFSIKLFHNFL